MRCRSRILDRRYESMSYMSYCKFEGTLSELRSCMNTVEEHVNEEAEYEVSDQEIRCFRDIAIEFNNFMHDMGLMDDEGYIDDDALDEVCEAMAKSYNEEEEE